MDDLFHISSFKLLVSVWLGHHWSEVLNGLRFILQVERGVYHLEVRVLHMRASRLRRKCLRAEILS